MSDNSTGVLERARNYLLSVFSPKPKDILVKADVRVVIKPMIKQKIEEMFKLYDVQADKNKYGNIKNKTTWDKLFSVQEPEVQGSLNTISGNLWNNEERKLATGNFTTFINDIYVQCDKKSTSRQNILVIKNSFSKTTGVHNVCKQATYDSGTTKTMMIIITNPQKSPPTYYAMRIEQDKASASDVSVKLMMCEKDNGGGFTTTPHTRPDSASTSAGGITPPGSLVHRPPSGDSNESGGSPAAGGTVPPVSPKYQPSDKRIDHKPQNSGGGGAGPASASSNIEKQLRDYTVSFYNEWDKDKDNSISNFMKAVNKFNGLTGEYLKANTQSNGSTKRFKWDPLKFKQSNNCRTLINFLYDIQDVTTPDVRQIRKSVSRCIMLICGVSLQDKVVVDCHTQKFTKWTVVYGLESTFAIFRDESMSEYTIVYAGKMRPVNGLGRCEEL
jgi:hypothetical protein